MKFISALILTIFFFLHTASAQVVTTLPFVAGETISYDIKKMMKVGNASIVYKGPAEIDGKRAVLIVFTSKAANFYDEEQIYLDPETLYPIVVKRDVNVWGKKEKITETYDQEKWTIKIVKEVGTRTEEINIQKNAPIENIYGFIYRFRFKGNFKAGEAIKVNLPTKEIVIHLRGDKKLNIAHKNFDTFYLESESKQYRVWLDSTGSHIPLRIDGAVGFGSTSMIINSYK